MPDFTLEGSLNGSVCGVDEVGRGPLAGPVVAACVYIPPDKYNLNFITQITDSKKISKKRMAILSDLIHENFDTAIAEIPPKKIDQINIHQATLLAMSKAFHALNKKKKQDAILVDGRHIPKNIPCPAQAIVKGDQKSYSIAAASIIAKHHRDEIMKKFARRYPVYGWENNAGYPTLQHRDAIKEHGITQHHRRSFAPVRIHIESKESQ